MVKGGLNLVPHTTAANLFRLSFVIVYTLGGKPIKPELLKISMFCGQLPAVHHHQTTMCFVTAGATLMDKKTII